MLEMDIPRTKENNMLGEGRQVVNVDISQAKDVLCGECENPYFMDVMRIKKISMLVSPTGKEELINVQVLLCTNCGAELNL